MTQITIPQTDGKYIFEKKIITMISKYKHDFSNDTESNLIITVYPDIHIYNDEGIDAGLKDIENNNLASEKEVKDIFTKWTTEEAKEMDNLNNSLHILLENNNIEFPSLEEIAKKENANYNK